MHSRDHKAYKSHVRDFLIDVLVCSRVVMSYTTLPCRAVPRRAVWSHRFAQLLTCTSFSFASLRFKPVHTSHPIPPPPPRHATHCLSACRRSRAATRAATSSPRSASQQPRQTTCGGGRCRGCRTRGTRCRRTTMRRSWTTCEALAVPARTATPRRRIAELRGCLHLLLAALSWQAQQTGGTAVQLSKCSMPCLLRCKPTLSYKGFAWVTFRDVTCEKLDYSTDSAI